MNLLFKFQKSDFTEKEKTYFFIYENKKKLISFILLLTGATARKIKFYLIFRKK